MPDFILNGQAYGDVAEALIESGGDPGILRPFKGKDGRNYVTMNQNGKPVTFVTNAPATLRKDEWITLDTAIIRAAQQRLRLWADVVGAGLTYTLPNGMGTTVLQHETQSDVGPATISMDGLRQSENDRPHFQIENLPIPIIHKDFHFSARQILTSRNMGTPLDVTMAEECGRKVAEETERLLLGIGDYTSYQFGGGTIYGYLNHPNRNLKVITNPTVGGWTPDDLVTEILEGRTQLQNDKHYGPYMVYTGLDWDKYMDADYSAAKGDLTLRQRIERIQGIAGVRTADYLTGYQIIMVQMTSNVVRAVMGMGITTLQWQTNGGLARHFKVMAIHVPQLRADFNGNMGLLHMNVA